MGRAASEKKRSGQEQELQEDSMQLVMKAVVEESGVAHHKDDQGGFVRTVGHSICLLRIPRGRSQKSGWR